MENKPSSVMFSPAVRKTQKQQGSDDFISRLEERDYWQADLSEEIIQFIQNMDSFYLATASKKGRPYIQHRGGPKGFIQVENNTTLLFPDFEGNRQYITIGNLAENDQAFIFFMDYPNRRRIKLWGRATVADIEKESLSFQKIPEKVRINRAIRFEIEAWDENCRQHIKPRYTADVDYIQELSEAKNKIAELEQQIKILEEQQ